MESSFHPTQIRQGKSVYLFRENKTFASTRVALNQYIVLTKKTWRPWEISLNKSLKRSILYPLTYFSIRDSDIKLIYVYQQDSSATPVDLLYSLHYSKVLSTGLCCTIYNKIYVLSLWISQLKIYSIFYVRTTSTLM